MKSQFIHIESYSLEKKDGSADAIGVLLEAMRTDSHSKHVQYEHFAKKVVGLELKAVEKEIKAASKKSFNGRKLRKDAKVLLAGVASYPFSETDEEFNNKDLILWIKMTCGFLKREYGENLKSVVYHGDESHPHLHFFCYDTNKMNVREIHQGIKQEIKSKAKTNTAKKREYKKGLVDFQDRYFETVSKRFEMKRNNDIKTVRMNKHIKKSFNIMKEKMIKLEEKNENLEKEVSEIYTENKATKKENEELKDIIKTLKLDIINLKEELIITFKNAYIKAKREVLRDYRVNSITDDDSDSFMSKKH